MTPAERSLLIATARLALALFSLMIKRVGMMGSPEFGDVQRLVRTVKDALAEEEE